MLCNMSPGTAVAPLQFLPCLHHKRTDALKYANTQDRYKFANAQICKCTNTRKTKKVHNSSVVLGGKYQVGGGDLLSIRKPSAVIPVSAGRIYFIICPQLYYIFGQIHFTIQTNTFWNLNIYIWKFSQIHFGLYREAISGDPGVSGQDLLYHLPMMKLHIWTNTFSSLNKYTLNFWQIQFQQIH